MDFSETIAACDLKVGRCRQLIEFMKVCRWRSGAVVRASDFGPRGPWFEPRPVHISLWPWASHIYLA